MGGPPCNKIDICGVILFLVLICSCSNVNCDVDCTNADIRNSIDNFYKLENCTIVTGYLAIILIEMSTPGDMEHIIFPHLREISGFFIIARTPGLKSIGQLFPNLVVIRGIRLLMDKYALVIYNNKNIEEIGLKSLIKIERGIVRIERNPELCYTDRILWGNLTSANETNIIEPVHPVNCRNKFCIGCDYFACWSVKNCQRFDTPYNRTGGIKCHPTCLGGCYDKTDKGCIVCRNLTRDDGKCVNKCEAPRILNPHNFRCLHPNTCLKRGWIVHENRCVFECPPGYQLQNVYDDKSRTTTNVCVFCQSNCTITCNGIEIRTLDDARKLKGCTVINGTLLVRINTDVPNMDLMNNLERNLGEIAEITAYLKVYRSIAITTLSFFKNLTVIHGKMLESGKYGLVIYDNPNLKTLWNWTQKHELTILNGGMSIHYNTKLCLAEIEKLQENTKYSNATDFICRETNGNKQSCNVILMQGYVSEASADNVTVNWTPFESLDSNYTLLGYIISYIETARTDITPQYGKDVCSKFSWHSVLLTTDTLAIDRDSLNYTITNLKPYTHYGVFVKSFSAEVEDLNIFDGQTIIFYFTTLPAVPLVPIVGTESKTPNSIQIRWVVDENENDLIEYFKISVMYRPDDIEFLDQRDFCEDHQANKTEDTSLPDVLSCCMMNDEDVPYDDLVEIPGECHNSPYDSDGYLQSDNYCKYNSYYHNTDYEFRDVMFKHVGLNNLQSSIDYSRTIRNYTLKNTHREYNISNLRPFGMYTFIVVACNQLNQCSPFYMHTDRSAPLLSNDDVEFELTQIDDSITIHFPPPPNPNGATVAFQINCLIVNDEKQEGTLCVTRKMHETNNFTFSFVDLPNGSYAIRLRSLSLAGAGVFSDWKYFKVKENVSNRTLQHTLIILFTTLLLIIVLVLIYKYYLARHCKLRSTSAARANLISMEYKPAVDEITWHLNYDSDSDHEFNRFKRSTTVEPAGLGSSNTNPFQAYIKQEGV